LREYIKEYNRKLSESDLILGIYPPKYSPMSNQLETMFKWVNMNQKYYKARIFKFDEDTKSLVYRQTL
jgi:transposase